MTFLLERAARRFVNRVRRDAGLPPIRRLEPGLRRSAAECPVARSIGCGALVGTDVTRASGVEYANPRLVKRFVRRFDGSRRRWRHLRTATPRRWDIDHLDFAPGIGLELQGPDRLDRELVARS